MAHPPVMPVVEIETLALDDRAAAYLAAVAELQAILTGSIGG